MKICPDCGNELFMMGCDCGYSSHLLLPDNPDAYDCSKMTDEQLIDVKNYRYDKSGWNEYDYAEFGAYDEAVRIEILKRNLS